jgi:hypothetical protein
LDHLVYAVLDLEAAIASFADRLGVAPVHGGWHTSLGTWNAILPLRDGQYVELIAADPEAEDPAYPRPFGLDELTAPQLVTWAARTKDIDAAVARARERGFDPGAVISIGRDTPDGVRLEWKLCLRAEPAGDGVVPFLIDWGDTPHPSAISGVSRLGSDPLCRLGSFAAVHPDPESIRKMLEALEVSLPVAEGRTPGLHATVAGPSGSVVLRASTE